MRFVLVPLLILLVTPTLAGAQPPQDAWTPGGGTGALLVGPVYDFDSGDTGAAVGLHGELTVHSARRLTLGVVLAASFELQQETVFGVPVTQLVLGLAPSVRLGFPVSARARPRFDLGVGVAHQRITTDLGPFGTVEETATGPLLRMTLGLDFEAAPGFLVVVEPAQIQVRFLEGETRASLALLAGLGTRF